LGTDFPPTWHRLTLWSISSIAEYNLNIVSEFRFL
jgi:hypothetical protein